MVKLSGGVSSVAEAWMAASPVSPAFRQRMLNSFFAAMLVNLCAYVAVFRTPLLSGGKERGAKRLPYQRVLFQPSFKFDDP